MQLDLFPGFTNPFRPGAGHMPPYLAGRDSNIKEFGELIRQEPILYNFVLTGLRGVGKTVLLETVKPRAISEGWVWAGTDVSQSVSVSEETLSIRILTDLAIATSTWPVGKSRRRIIGFEGAEDVETVVLDYGVLKKVYAQTPGLVSDKLKAVLTLVVQCRPPDVRGIIFAYDEAQNLSDHDSGDQYPLSLLLDVFQSLQRMEYPLLLVFAGLPTLFPRLVEARTFSERMFRVMFLASLDAEASRAAITMPIADERCPVRLSEDSIKKIVNASGGYPYFIQFICREVYDAFIQQNRAGKVMSVPLPEIIRKLDCDFFAGRWARATDRQRELLGIIARLDNCDDEFTVQEIVDGSKSLGGKPFSNSHANQMLATMCANGLVYKNRYGKYSFAVPLFGQFIQRQMNVS
jgi:hypothetical protein